MRSLSGRIMMNDAWFSGTLYFDTRIRAFEPGPEKADQARIVPGFIDLHVHGGNGVDAMEGEEALVKMSRWHARHGTCCLLATTISASVSELKRTLKAVEKVSAYEKPRGARILGCHLEGPYINSEKKGAHPVIPLDRDDPHLLYELCESRAVRVITLAPETFHENEFIRHLTERGIRVQIGHSMASYQEVLHAMDEGAAGFTHLFNAMSPLQHRAPGVVGAAFAKAQYAEIIPDLFHVHEGAMLAAFRAIPNLYCVTDASAASGMPDGHYPMGHQVLSKCPNGVFLKDGTIAGSTLTMDQAFRNLLSIGLTEIDAVKRLSTFPADYLNLEDRGRIRVGAYSDLVVLNEDNSIRNVFIEGEALEFDHD